MKPQCSIRVASMALIASLLSACGGGGSANSISSQSVTYTAAASAGELVKYIVDTTKLTYAYEITQSAYGLEGKTGTGTLTKNADGSYRLSGIENGSIVILESGLMLGSVAIDLNTDGTDEVVPVLGAAQTVDSTQDAAGTYNYISRRSVGGNWSNDYGTIQIKPDGSWTGCSETNLGDSNASCANPVGGITSPFTAGLSKVYVGDATTPAGTIFLFKDNTTGQKALFLDLNGATSLGTGAIFGATQQLPSSVNGRWHYLHNNGLRGYVDVNGTSFTDHLLGYPQTSGTFTQNSPWTGLATTSDGFVLMPTGSGMYAGYFGVDKTISIGIRP